jgi:hypothetical protein
VAVRAALVGRHGRRAGRVASQAIAVDLGFLPSRLSSHRAPRTRLSIVPMSFSMCRSLFGMSSVIWHITMSLDGFIAGPNDSMDWAVREWSDDGTNMRDIEVDRSGTCQAR